MRTGRARLSSDRRNPHLARVPGGREPSTNRARQLSPSPVPPLVLLVGANDDDRMIYGHGLRSSGIRIRFVTPLKKVEEWTARLQPDLVVVHLRIPEEQGWACCDRLHDNPACQQIPVLLLTAAVRPDGRNRARARATPNCAAFVAKPCDPENLAAVIRRVLDGERGIEFLYGYQKRRTPAR